jgi:predicted enzyme related to lactoylglutathione lyase
MATRIVNIIIATVNERALAAFWSALLGWRIVQDTPGEIDVRAPESLGWMLDLLFEPVTEPKTMQNRVHLDLASSSAEDQAAIIERARQLGARSVDIGQSGVPWEVMADPEGNEFCVLEPRDVYRDAGSLAAIVVEAADPHALGRFWTEATGWHADTNDPNCVGLAAPDRRGPALEFIPSTRPKTVQNRLHIDVAPYPDETRTAEMARLSALGAYPIDIGQGQVPWEVMADPEGNEFCILTPR